MPLPTMHLRTLHGDRTCVVIRASLLSEVATGLFLLRSERRSEVKTTESEKSYKETRWAWLILETP